jgi:hypothetical protein
VPRRRVLVKSLRLSATLLVLALFALLSYRIVHGLSGAHAAAKRRHDSSRSTASPTPPASTNTDTGSTRTPV